MIKYRLFQTMKFWNPYLYLQQFEESVKKDYTTGLRNIFSTFILKNLKTIKFTKKRIMNYYEILKKVLLDD